MNIQQNLNTALAAGALASKMTEGHLVQEGVKKAHAEKKIDKRLTQEDLERVNTTLNIDEKELAKIQGSLDVYNKQFEKEFTPGKKTGKINYEGRLRGEHGVELARNYTKAMEKKDELLETIYNLDPSMENSNALALHRASMGEGSPYANFKSTLATIQTRQAQGEKGALKEKAEADAVAEASIRAEEVRNSRTAVPNKLQEMGGNK